MLNQTLNPAQRRGALPQLHACGATYRRRFATLHPDRHHAAKAAAHLARREIAYQETGALIDQRRLYGNLLSSMPLAFNLFAPLRLNPPGRSQRTRRRRRPRPPLRSSRPQP